MEKKVSTHKTEIDQSLVMSFLQGHLSVPVENLEYISGGEGAQAFCFETAEGDRVIRVSKHGSRAFKKDEYAHDHFASTSIPIPDVLDMGKLDNGYNFAISEKVSGAILNDIPKEKSIALVPELFSVLDSIHEIDVSKTAGYGKWDEQGNAEYQSWQDMILDADKFVKAKDGKPDLFETTFLERELWDKTFNKVKDLMKYCPEERYLVHGDYGFNNVLSDGEHITGVIDWAESMYGDFLFDVAWLSFWSHDTPGINYEKSAKEHYQTTGKVVPHFDERVLCYKLLISLSASGFYAYSGQEEKYKFIKRRVGGLLAE